jgi:hypothetical protein
MIKQHVFRRDSVRDTSASFIPTVLSFTSYNLVVKARCSTERREELLG